MWRHYQGIAMTIYWQLNYYDIPYQHQNIKVEKCAYPAEMKGDQESATYCIVNVQKNAVMWNTFREYPQAVLGFCDGIKSQRNNGCLVGGNGQMCDRYNYKSEMFNL